MRKSMIYLLQGYRPSVEGWSKEVRLLSSIDKASMIVDFRSERTAMTANRLDIRNGPVSFIPALCVARIMGNSFHAFCFMSERFIPRILPSNRAIATIIGPGSVEIPMQEQRRFRAILVECRRDLDIYLNEGFDESKLGVVLPCAEDGAGPTACNPPDVAGHRRVLVGSIPFSKNRFSERGMSFALDVAREAKDVDFVFPCRTSSLSDELLRRARRGCLGNVEISQRIANSPRELYTDISCTAFFFTTIRGNKSCPNMAVESISYGIPIAATGFVGISRELNEEGVAQILPSSPREAAEIIRKLLDKNANMRTRCVQVARRIFDKEQFLTAYRRCYARIHDQ